MSTNIKLYKLILECKKETISIDLSKQISIFWGPINSGKSTILRLIDYCFGADWVPTPAIDSEVNRVELHLKFNDAGTILARDSKNASKVRVTWFNSNGDMMGDLLAPIRGSSSHNMILGSDVETLSDLIFYLLDKSPLKVPKSKTKGKTQMVRLSFRDILFYCYIDQDEIDSNFYYLGEKDYFRREKSRDVMEYLLGLYDNELSNLETELNVIKHEKDSLLSDSDKLRTFLKQFGYDSEQKMNDDIIFLEKNLDKERKNLLNLNEKIKKDTSPIIKLNNRINELNADIYKIELNLKDISYKLEQNNSLINELLTQKQKTARYDSSVGIFTVAKFDICPQCGNELDNVVKEPDICPLCGKRHPKIMHSSINIGNEIDKRVSEIEEIKEKLKTEQTIQYNYLDKLYIEKNNLSNQITFETNIDDSLLISTIREVERNISRNEEKITNLKKMLQMPESVKQIEETALELAQNEEKISLEIKKRKEKIREGYNLIKEIEDIFLQSIQFIKLPGVYPEDVVKINTKTWKPYIHSSVSNAVWGFDEAGSSGKKVLFNVCYALTIHVVAQNHNLPLPPLLIIDTPMKNIHEERNRDLFEAFYDYLYTLAAGPLNSVQFIIVDKDFISPEPKLKINYYERLMTRDDPEHPPLIPYYKGP